MVFGVCEGWELFEKVFKDLDGCDVLLVILTGEGKDGGFGKVSEVDRY